LISPAKRSAILSLARRRTANSHGSSVYRVVSPGPWPGLLALSVPPILLGLPLHAGAFGFLLLIQSGEYPERLHESFRFDTIPSNPYCRRAGKRTAARLIHVLIEPQPLRRDRAQARERSLAHRKRFGPQVVAVKPYQSRVQRNTCIVPPIRDEVECREPAVARTQPPPRQ
jgi:hypothetical protein